MNKNKLWITLFILPTAMLFLLIYLFPLGLLVTTSFTNWSLGTKMSFIGLNNYIDLFSNDNAFSAGLWNTLLWVLLQCIVNVGIGVITSLLVMKNNKFMRFTRIVYLLPNQISVAAFGILIFFMFNPTVGPVNKIIGALLNKPFDHNWFFDTNTAFITVTFSTILYAGIITLLVSSEIGAISESLFESAKIDGANDLQINVFITIPMLRNIIGTCLILAVISALRSFEIIQLTTRGGPGNTTMNLSYYIYQESMISGKFGYANAVGTVLLFLGIVIIFTLNKAMNIGKSDI